ncbi:MAG: tyrosine-protein phosphatase [Anaerolineales bacterium]|nr:tyrosine-protein phosphatase [Anaerolineales bacterium]
MPRPEPRPHVRALIKQAQNRGEVYGLILDHYPENTQWAMHRLTTAVSGGVVMHCQSGKDRTGLMAALLLRLAGVPDEVIVADYALSQERLWPLEGAEWERQNQIEGSSFWQRPTATAEVMEATLAHLDERYGGVRPYLLYTGLSEQEVDYLAGLLVDE